MRLKYTVVENPTPEYIERILEKANHIAEKQKYILIGEAIGDDI